MTHILAQFAIFGGASVAALLVLVRREERHEASSPAPDRADVIRDNVHVLTTLPIEEWARNLRPAPGELERGTT